jgi:hypothetical protein
VAKISPGFLVPGGKTGKGVKNVSILKNKNIYVSKGK